MATVKKAKKYQGGGSMDPRAAAILKKKAASDTTKMYNREEALASYNKLKPKAELPTKMVEAKSNPTKYAVVNKGDTTYASKADFERKYGGKKKSGGAVKKAKSGGSFPDLNKDGKVTRADILKGRGVIAKKGAKIMPKAKAGCKACWGTKMKKK